jgi:predicted transcriptional regulator
VLRGRGKAAQRGPYSSCFSTPICFGLCAAPLHNRLRDPDNVAERGMPQVTRPHSSGRANPCLSSGQFEAYPQRPCQAEVSRPGPSIQRQGYRLTSAGVDLQRRCLEQPLLQTPSKDTLRRKIIEAIPRNGSRANVILRRAGILERQQRSVRVILCQMVHEGLLERAKLPRIRPQTYRLTERGKSLGRAYRAIPVARC